MEWVITAISEDRAGIVEEIAGIITKHDGNWVKSSMSRLSGQFAGMVQFTSSQSTNVSALKTELEGLTEKGIIINLVETSEQPKPKGQKAQIELTGIDHKGIVAEITHLLAEKQVTIEELETDIFTASMAGEAMFTAKAEIRLPEGLTFIELREATEAIAEDIMVEINLQMDKAD
ncbi:MAG: hypothetical protein DHS20C07_23230 [Methyloligella sp.]|nr:MAG: hypothetical protein DHS20C07_23230 [Methyloligella sp.]